MVAAPYEPFAFDRDGVPTGFDLDLLNVVCRANRWTYELEWVPFGEVWERLRSGKADLAVGALYATPERRASFPTSRTYLRTGLGIVSRPDRPMNGPGDLGGARIGVKAKATGEAWGRRRLQAGARFDLVPFQSTEESLEALLRGEVDAVLNDHLNSEFLLAQRYAGRLVAARSFGSPLLLTRDELAFPFRPGLEPVRDTFDATLRELERGGTLERLRWQWLPPHATLDWGELLGWAAAFLLALVLAAASWVLTRRRSAQRKNLAESERHYRRVVEQAPLGILLVRGKQIAFASPKALELLHAPTGQGVIGATAGDLVVPADRPQITEFRLAMEAGDRATRGFDLTVRRPDGSTFPGHVSIRRADLEGGLVSLVFFEDRSSLQQAEARLADSEQARARFLKHLPGMAYQCHGDRDWTMLAVSDGALELTGHWPEELTSPQGTRYAQIIHSDDRARVTAGREQALASGKPFQFRYRILTASGRVKWVHEQGWPVPGTGHPPAEVEGFIVDETDRVEAHQELDRSEAEYRRIFEDSTEGIYVSTAEGRPVLANPALVRMLGYDSEEELSRRDIAREGYVDPADRERFAALMERDGRVTDFESRWYRKDLSVLVTLVNARAVYGPDGKVALYEGMVRDVTEERRAQAALVESEARYRALFENSYDAIFVADAETGRLLDANLRAQQLVGRSLDEIRTLHQMDLHPEEERERYRQIFAAHSGAEAGGLTPDLLVVHRDGRRIPVEIAGSTFALEGRRVQIGIFRDATARKAAELALRQSEEHLRKILDHSPVCMAIVGADGTIEFINRKFVETFGYAHEDIPDMDRWTRQAYPDPAYREELVAKWARLIEEAVAENREIEGGEYQVRCKDGSVKTCFIFGAPVGDKYVSMLLDVTERRAAEAALRSSEAELRAILEHSPISMAIATLEGAIEFINRRVTETTGYRLEDIPTMARFWTLAFPDPDYRKEAAAAWGDRLRRAIEEGREVEGHEYRITCKDGAERVSLIFGVPVGGKVFVASMDVTERLAVENALRKSEAQYRLTIDSMADAVHLVDRDLRILLFNGTLQRWVDEQGPSEAIAGRTVFEVFPFLPEKVRDEYEEVFRTGVPLVSEEHVVTGLGTIYTETRKTPVLEEGRVVRVLTVIRDVTERHRAETALRESESRLRKILEQSPLSMAIVGLDGTIEYINRKAVETFGFAHEEIPTMERWWAQAYPDPAYREEVVSSWMGRVESALAGGHEIEGAEYRVTCKDGSEKTCFIFGVPVADKVFVLFQDVSARRRAEEALRESEERYRIVVEQTGQMVYDYDVSTGRITWSGAIETVTGWPPEEFECDIHRWEEFIHPEDRTRALEFMGEAMASQESYRVEYRFLRRDGSHVWVEDHGVFLSGPDGKAGRMLGTMADQSQRKQAERAVAASAARLQHLLTAGPTILYSCRPEGDFGATFISQNVVDILGLKPEQFTSESSFWASRIHPEDAQRVFEGVGVLFQKGIYTHQYRFLDGQGRWRWMRDDLRLIRDGEGTPLELVGSWTDVTELAEAEQETARSRERLQLILDRNPLACIVWDTEFRVAFWNPSAERLFGYSAGEAVGRHSYDLIVPPQVHGHTDEIWRRLLEGDETAHSENENRRSDGTPLLCEWFNTPLKDAGGQVVGVLSMAQDITVRRRAERQILDRNRQLSALLSASQAMTGFLDLQGSARGLCQAALEAFDLRMVWIGLVVPESTEVEVIASAGHDEGYTEEVRVRWDESPRSQGPTGKCIKTRQPVVGYPHQGSFAPWRQAAEARGYRASCALPLLHEEAVRGALTLYSGDPDAFGPETLEVLQIFARQATMLIVNAALYEEARRTVEALLAESHRDRPPEA